MYDTTIVTDFEIDNYQAVQRLVWSSTDYQKGSWRTAIVFSIGVFEHDPCDVKFNFIRAFRRELVAGVEK